MDCMSALKNINVDVSTWDIIVIHIVTFKLDAETRKQWELHISSFSDLNDLPTLEQLKCFMESRFRALEFTDTKKANIGQYNNNPSTKPKTLLATNVSMRCEFCSDHHKLCFCKKFAKLKCAQRRNFVAKNSICFNCLGRNHTVYECNKPTTCRICKRRHHSLLHPEEEKAEMGAAIKEAVVCTSSEANNSAIVSCLSMRKISGYGQVLLPTALVNAESKSGGNQIVRALLDQGSQACFITEAAAQLLQLKKSPIRATITGLGEDKSLTAKYVVTIYLKSRIDNNYKIQVKAYVLKNITSYLPEQKIESIDWIGLQDLCLADPKFNVSNKIDMLLGANVFSQILMDGVKRSPNGSLIAQNTTLGWIVSGIVDDSSGNYKNNSKITVMHAQINEYNILKQFWELEEQPRSTKSVWSEEEQKCEEIFTSTTKRTTEGRYIVKLPFRDNQPRCLGGGSRQIAVTKFKALEKRLSRDLVLKKNYTEVINEYLQLGHMRRLRKDDNEINEAVYLPHHAVVREDKTTTKVRVVFNASSKNNYGVSLNETLMIGPRLQPDLRHLVMRWRIDPIVLVADIIKMYRQVRVAEDNTKFQRIVWRENPESEIENFELLTVTFGIASAPYLAVRVLNQISLDEGKDFPLAAPRVLQAFYMDDLMTGCCDVKEGVEVYKQMTELLARGGFKLQKWNSNNEELLSQISINEKLADMNKEDSLDRDMLREYKQKREMQEGNKQDIHNILKLKETESLKNNKEIEVKTENTTKILGITWDRHEDRFRYSVNLPMTTTGPETKRTILSIIARLYDPLGWIAPSIILAKMFIQRLWLAGTSWDEPIPDDLLQDWNTYRNELPQLTSVRIPRWLGTSTTDTNTELHGFCDASKSAYAAVVYVRVVDCDGNTKVSLLTAKTRVAPIKQISIPRLELCGAVLLAQLLTEVAEVLNINKSNIKAWTDSTVVLAWLNSHPSRWKTFVANRVSEILTNLNSSQWYHVSTKENPADCASRGVQPEALAGNALWFFGPNFLREKTGNIPYKRPINLKINLEEAIKSHINVISDDEIFQRFSSLQRLLRVIAYCRRFNTKNKCTERKSYLTKSAIEQALMCCIKKVQKEEFGEEYLQIKKKGLLSKSSKLKSLCPYLDNNDIMRVSGRLQNSQLPEQTKHPIILPHSAYFTKLVISEAHQNTLHGGVQLMVNYLRTMYWIIGVKNLAKQHVRRCVICVRQNAKVQNPFMGSLPAVRCTPARAFLHSGVDYAGPISIRTTKGRGHNSHKGYICLFICMSTRAIHLEAVSDMSTQAFLAAFRRFVARRGHCAQIWSDNGTTFVGASRELEQLKNNQEDLAMYLESHGTEWHFIPPHAPNFGGLWEAGVKSTKLHLKRVIGESTLTFEEMSTLLSQIEACLNSRPITVDSSHPSDPLPLTPGHFLIGGPLIAVPEFNDYLESNISSLKRWQFIQQMLQRFWRRWSQEYLSNLMNRYKWSSREPEPNVGDVVLIKEDNLPPSRWLMGRIVEKHPGIDDVTRVVTIRTKSSFIKRPTSKLCVLPVSK